MRSDSPGSRPNSTDSPTESRQWRGVDVDRSQGSVVTAGHRLVADGWSRTRIHGTQDSVTVVYRSSDARREMLRRRLLEVLDE